MNLNNNLNTKIFCQYINARFCIYIVDIFNRILKCEKTKIRNIKELKKNVFKILTIRYWEA